MTTEFIPLKNHRQTSWVMYICIRIIVKIYIKLKNSCKIKDIKIKESYCCIFYDLASDVSYKQAELLY